MQSRVTQLEAEAEESSRLRARLELATAVDVRAVACGAYQTAAVTRAGELFCWGWQFEDGPSGSIQARAARSKWPLGSGAALCHGLLR